MKKKKKMTDRAQRKDSDLVDARAQLEVMKLQVHILKETLKEKEKEIEKEKKLGSEWKREAFKKVREQNHATGEKILQSQEYKVRFLFYFILFFFILFFFF